MEKRHQIFVSSTYQDLKEERKEIINAILELECMPAGMELFPAADEESWNLIKRVIDDSDYYIVVIAGKYGSLNKDGVSYTEMEYDYAISTGKPVIGFIHENIGELKSSQCESSTKTKKKLKEFTEKVKLKNCKLWDSAKDLGGKVSRSIVNLRRDRPTEGWIRGRYAADATMLKELNDLRKKVEVLSKEDYEFIMPPKDYEKYAKGDDQIYITQNLVIDQKGTKEERDLGISWDTILSYVGPTLSGECSEKQMFVKIELAYLHSINNDDIEKINRSTNIIVPYVTEDRIKIQLQALGYMRLGTKKRHVTDTNTYWKLTRFGEKVLIDIRADKINC